MTVEASRKEGPFDPRDALIAPTPSSVLAQGEGRFDWEGFVHHFFPRSRRHDLDVLAAYESYRNGGRGPRPAETPAVETDRWESEGGS